MFQVIRTGTAIEVGNDISVVTEEETEMTVEWVATTGVGARVGIMEGLDVGNGSGV